MSASHQELLQRIRNKTGRVGVVGLGYVGLPLLLEIREAGFSVIGVDPDETKLEALRAGRSYIDDIPDERLAALADEEQVALSPTSAPLAEADAILVCVPTPLNKTREPDVRFVRAAFEGIRDVLRPGHLVVLESTTYPGTTEELVLPILEGSGLKVEEEYFLAFSPERVDPGNKTWTVHNTPKVIGGHGPAASEAAAALYGSFIDKVVPVSSTKSAEMVKLLENTFRMINIGLVNEVAVMCNKLDIDVWEVIDAAATKPFGFMPFYPGPGLGGHCIPVDPLYLGWKLRTVNYRARFVELADHVNSTMPNYIVFRAAAALNQKAQAVRGSNILLLGVAYKASISDVRESPALPIFESLAGLGAKVEYSDPHVPGIHLGGFDLEGVPVTPERLKEADLVIMLTDHPEFDHEEIAEHAPLILDTRNAFKALGKRENLIRL
jgi:UDP-N-acetyl-D-glucosamine dehydrogenase